MYVYIINNRSIQTCVWSNGWNSDEDEFRPYSINKRIKRTMDIKS